MEKLLKAALMQRADFPPKTHDLASLSNRLSRLEPKWQWDSAELERLTKGAVDFRYPGPRPSPATAQSGYREAERLRAALLELISSREK